MWRIFRKSKIRKLQRAIRKIEVLIDDQEIIKKDQTVQVNVLAAQIDREEKRFKTVENQYQDSTDDNPLQSLKIELLNIKNSIARRNNELKFLQANLAKVDATINASRQNLVVKNSQLLDLQTFYNKDDITGAGKGFGRSYRGGIGDIEEFKGNEENLNESMKNEGPEDDYLINLEKSRLAVNNAKAAGKSEKEINEIKAQKQ